MLKRDFGLNVKLPKGHLCPAIPNRLDYIHLIEDLLLDQGIDFFTERILGLDIGAGASAVYPLLACSMHENWKFTATEVDSEAYQWASENIVQNGLDDRIKVILNKPDDRLLLNCQGVSMHFCLCNPPFYSGREEIQEKRQLKQSQPQTIFEYTDSESIFSEGGEVAFIARIIRESCENSMNFYWYTALVGIKADLLRLRSILRECLSVTQVKVMSSQVGRTKRWILAWSFYSPPSRTVFVPIVDLPIMVEFRFVKEYIIKVLRFEELDSQTFLATAITWTRSARRSTAIAPPSCHLKVSFRPTGRHLLAHLDSLREEWDNFISFTNHLQSRYQSSDKKVVQKNSAKK